MYAFFKKDGMKIRGIAAIILLASILLSFSAGALAVAGEDDIHTFQEDAELQPGWEDFTDVSGHWAENSLKKGFENGHIRGFEDAKLRPDAPITAAQMITILTRVLDAKNEADISAWGLSPDAWYYEAAAKAAYLGILETADKHSMDTSMLRQDALAMLARAFVLNPADLSVLDAFSDAGLITAANRPHIAALVEQGFVEGFDGALDANGGITRAQFISVLYRVPESLIPMGEAKNIVITGNEKSVTIDGEHSSVVVSGNTNLVILSDDAKIGTLTVSGSGNWLTLSCAEISEICITGDYNTLCLSGRVTNMTIYGHKTQIDGIGTGRVDNLTLNASGCSIAIETINFTDNSRDYDTDRVMNLVTSTYKGDFTLDWAETHDYEDYEKEIWVNAKGYSSNTDYLIWVNLAMQRVNIFTGSKGNWTLTKSCIIASGGPKSGTPAGVYYTTYKLASGWTTSTYTCRPVVGFKENSGYAFHSRLYYPNSDKLTDAAIGYPVSHGCIRMYDEDIYYIYDHIPLKTTVIVY